MTAWRAPLAVIRQPLGHATVGGLIVSRMLTLFTTPVIYLYMDMLRSRVAELKRAFAAPGRSTGRCRENDEPARGPDGCCDIVSPPLLLPMPLRPPTPLRLPVPFRPPMPLPSPAQSVTQRLEISAGNRTAMRLDLGLRHYPAHPFACKSRAGRREIAGEFRTHIVERPGAGLLLARSLIQFVMLRRYIPHAIFGQQRGLGFPRILKGGRRWPLHSSRISIPSSSAWTEVRGGLWWRHTYPSGRSCSAHSRSCFDAPCFGLCKSSL